MLLAAATALAVALGHDHGAPYAKQNFVDHSTSDQSSILKFVEEH